MDTIGSVGYERQSPFRQARPPAAPSDRDRDRGNNHDSDHGRHHDNNASDSDTALARSAAGPQRKLNVTA
jgi:hypothetical protein